MFTRYSKSSFKDDKFNYLVFEWVIPIALFYALFMVGILFLLKGIIGLMG